MLKPRQGRIQSQVGPISSSSRPLRLQQKVQWGRTKADPSGKSQKKHSKNTQQALARSLRSPSLKLTAKESPGGRKFGLCPTCKCAAWGAAGGGKSHTQVVWIQRKPTQTPPATLNPTEGRNMSVVYWTWLCRWVSGEKFIAGDLKQNSRCQFAMSYLQKTKAFICSKKPKLS